MPSELITAKFGAIPADYYSRDDIAVLERERIFKKAWLCVGFIDDLKNHHDFITVNLGTLGIVVQNFHGQLKAFHNVCSHRFSRIQTECKGNRPLICPYHGWTYNEEGHLAGIPSNKRCFGFGDLEKKELGLTAYSLALCGRFVFVKVDAEGPSLKEFLGAYYDALIHLTEICPDRFESTTIEWDANWKMGMDNAAEGYHVPLVHSDSFAKVLTLNLEISIEGPHSLYLGKLTEGSLTWWGNVKKHCSLVPSTRYPEYANFLIFPNIVITFSYGSFLTFQTFLPDGVNKLTITSNSWLAQSKHGPVRETVITSLKEFSAKVRDEDKTICAISNKGISDLPNSRALLLGDLEGRIANFQKAYAQYMGMNT